MARVFGLEALRMADSDVLPYDYVTYAREVASYLEAAKSHAADAGMEFIDFDRAEAAAARFASAAERVRRRQRSPSGSLGKLNLALRQVESDLLTEAGLPHRPWYRHTIFAPGEFTGYAAVVLPGVNDAIDQKDSQRAVQQLAVLAQALERAALTLDNAR
jgi:N-acetylated-alpha-linked acidic dipeptidase